MLVLGVDGKCCKAEGVDRGTAEGAGTCLGTRCEVAWRGGTCDFDSDRSDCVRSRWVEGGAMVCFFLFFGGPEASSKS